MELGERLRQARLEAGLTQRALCGEAITRNMLSQIENGSAKPSMDTLRYLASRLGKPLSYFLDEETPVSPNLSVILQARQGRGASVLEALEHYDAPDPVFDPERWLLEAIACMDMAQEAIAEGKKPYAAALLEQCAEAGAQTVYYTEELERRRLLLCFQAGQSAASLAGSLPDHSQELLLRASAALEANAPQRCAAILEAGECQAPQWHYLRGEAHFALGEYAQAVKHYEQAEAYAPRQVYQRLEVCCRELEDFKMAYYYACKQR